MNATDELDLTAAAQAPDDDAARLVLQDALLERKDPRGEFLALQFKQLRLEDTAEDRARLAKLLTLHRTTWLGALAPFVLADSTRFERGFLARAALAPGAFADGARTKWLGEPTLPLLRELWVPAGVTPQDLAATLRAPAFARLGVVTCEELRLVEGLSRAGTPWTVGGVGLVGTVKQVMDVLDRALAAPAFASLGTVVLELRRFGRSAALELSKRLATAAFVTRLKRLEVRADVDGDVVGYACAVLGPLTPALTLEAGSLALHARRGARLDVDLVGAHGPEPLLKAIGALSAVGTLRVQQRDRLEPGEVQLDVLRGHLRRLRPVRTSLPVGWGIPDEG
jgi:uncharacterized protein (TIGR02996 family)